MNVPNLDCMTVSDLVEFLTTIRTDAQVRAMVGSAPNGAPRFGLMDMLNDYARLKRHAMLARERGEIQRASTLESRLDAMYERLPADLRW